jgi:transcriptional regulator with XRE-family HTH domain
MVTRIGPKKLKPRRIFLAEWRKHRGLTQLQLAERLETTEATISRNENLQRDPTLGFLKAAADALNCTVGDIVERPPPAPKPDGAPADDSEIIGAIEDILKRRA